MKRKTTFSISMIAIVLFFVASAVAKSRDSKDVLFHYDATIAGTHLTSGNYSVNWQTHSPAATVSFLQKGKVVATAEGTVVDRGSKYPSNEVVYGEAANGAHVVHEIRFRGSSEVIVFNE